MTKPKTPKTPERVVHAFGGLGMRIEMVRYNEKGSFWLEWEDGHRTRMKNVDEAAFRSVALWYNHNGSVNFDQPGGETFNRKVRKIVIEHEATVQAQKDHETANALRILNEFLTGPIIVKAEVRGIQRAIAILSPSE